MTPDTEQNLAVDVLQELGMSEYESKCFVGLSRLPKATAKRLSEVTDVPRTRVYDSVNALEEKGLVEIQHTSPRQFRGVPLDEALDTLKDMHKNRLHRLRDSLQELEPITIESCDDGEKEVWALTSDRAIETRTQNLIETATSEVILAIGGKTPLTDALVRQLERTGENISVLVAVMAPIERERINDVVADSAVTVREMDWLRYEAGMEDETAIGRLLLVDRRETLISSVEPDTGAEHAICGRGLRNGLVVISRRLLEPELFSDRNPDMSDFR